jgi:ribose 5-phosphate isomerase B
MKLAIGADHRGAAAARQLADRVKTEGHQVLLFGSSGGETVDYPDASYQVGCAVSSGKADRGVLIDGTGVGSSISANKVKGVRAALVHDELTAEMSRGHNDANVLCLSADLLGQRLIEKIVQVWLATPYQGGRHDRRIRKIAAIENGQDPTTLT